MTLITIFSIHNSKIYSIERRSLIYYLFACFINTDSNSIVCQSSGQPELKNFTEVKNLISKRHT